MLPVYVYLVLIYIDQLSLNHSIYVDDEDNSSMEKDRDSVYEDLSEYSSGRGSLEMSEKPADDTTSTTSKSSKMSTLEMFGKKGTVLRALWAEMPEVWYFTWCNWCLLYWGLNVKLL